MSDTDRILRLAGLATASVANETVARELKNNAQVEAKVNEAKEGTYMKQWYNYSEDFAMLELYVDGELVDEWSDYFHSNETGNPLQAKFIEMAEANGVDPIGLKVIDGEDGDEGVFTSSGLKWDSNEAKVEEVDKTIELDRVEEDAGRCGVCGNDVCTCTDVAMESDCDCEDEEETLEEMEVVSEAPTMDTTQLINLMRLSGINEETIKQKLDEWANTPEGVGEVEPTAHGDAYDFAQSVNLSLKRYLDAEDMKVQVKEHTVENMKALYESTKNSK